MGFLPNAKFLRKMEWYVNKNILIALTRYLKHNNNYLFIVNSLHHSNIFLKCLKVT